MRVRVGPVVAGITLVSFVASMLPPRVARAESAPPPAAEAPAPAATPAEEASNVSEEPAAAAAPSAEPKSDSASISDAPPEKAKAAPKVVLPPIESGDPSRTKPVALPSGADKSGVTSKSISVPKGAGTIQGMEESFSAQLSTGIATFSVPISLPAARGGAQPSLGLSYSSSGGFGVAGTGWSIGVPFIARQTDRGVPSYDDQSSWHPNQDRFVFNGGQELVPICTVGAGPSCAGALKAAGAGASANSSAGAEKMPSWSTGWQYFRPRVEGSFLRFFWSPDHKTWRVQDKSGVTMELGAPLDGSSYADALERNPQVPNEIYRWHLVRQYDTWGEANPPSGTPQPVNVVVFRYLQDNGSAYLSDIYDTPPAGASDSLASYAHHTRIVYEQRPDPTHSYRSGWRMEQRLRLSRIDAASKTFFQGASARRMVRRYHLSYETGSHVSLLSSVQVEGRCTGSETEAPSESSGVLPATTCPRLPPMTFGYGHVKPFTVSGAPGVADLPGYEGFDERIRTMLSSPPHSVDEELTDLFDVNSDALPDVLVTAAGVYGSGHGVFFNGASGDLDRFSSAQPMSILGVLGAGPTTITLKNQNLAPLDLDGDGTVDLLHMPKVKTYSVYAPEKAPSGWLWRGREVTTANGLSPKIDLGQDALDTQVMDVDFDGLVDVVVSTGTEMQTFFALGRYPVGDGQFGSGSSTGPASAKLSNEPVRTCVPWSATPVRFSDPDIKVSDMNGDGIADIVRVRKGDVRYWPGRGNGFWGTGKRDDCGAGTFGSNRHVIMTSGPQYSDIQGESLRLDDVNGDGLTDLVQVRFTDVDVWINVDGVSWTERHIIKGTPASPSYANRVRLVDVNGSGTRDVLWGNGNKYQYMDLAGGERPWILTQVDNGLGKTTELEYSTSTAEMLAADKAGSAWTSRMPTVVHVVKRVTESDNLTIIGRPPAKYTTEYSYRDPVFEGRQREFRGFRKASARKIGDENSPTDVTESTFLLGECVDEDATDGADACAVAERWRDNPREALKGLPLVTEKRDEGGRYLSTEHTGYFLRHLYTGLDGRAVRHAFEATKDTWLYDTTLFVAAKSSTDVTDVQFATGPDAQPDAKLAVGSKLDLRSSTGRVRLHSESTVDRFGNRLDATAKGCTEGCPQADEEITTHTEPGRPASDPTGWLWRTVSSYVTGNQYFLGKQRETTTDYNPQGAPTKTTSVLKGTLPLGRSHASSGAVAPNPAGASTDAPIVWTNSYDNNFGNLVSESGPNGRCREVLYDSEYAQLPTLEKIYITGCGGDLLSTAADYDRGFALVNYASDMQGQPTRVTYDSFGRLSELFRSDPETPGMLSMWASVKIEYFLPPDLGSPTSPARHSLIHTQTQDAKKLSAEEYLESWAYVDGLGRTLVTLAEAEEETSQTQRWIVGAQSGFDGKGALERKHLERFYTGSPKSFPFGAVPSTPYGRQAYDAFGRQVITTDLDGTVTLYSAYHALSTDMWDAADLGPGPHAGTFASERKDGHGRTLATTERFHEGPTLRERETSTKYLPTGEPQSITRTLVGAGKKVTRWMRYDSLGRMVLNVEPNTSLNFTDTPTADPANVKAWRYAYNDAGDLVGTSDARGCGTNFAYDGAGRLKSEDYSPCDATHATYSAPNLAGKTGVEILYHYDTVPADAPAGLDLNPTYLPGRLVAVYDRASITMSRYDGRGRVTKSAVRVAKPGPAADALADRYAPNWYFRDFEFDSADREIAATTGATLTDLQGMPSDPLDHKSAVVTEYSARGTVKSVGGSYGTLVKNVIRAADGLLEEVTYGDAAGTTTGYAYDVRRRVSSVQTYRGPPPSWTGTPTYKPAPAYTASHQPTYQLLLQDDELAYDVVSNPIEIRDWRIESEWPAGAKPVTKKAQYDDLYRLKRLDYQYTGGDDKWTPPFDAENTGSDDPRRAAPSPHVSFDKRVGWQTYSYDWLGNTAETDDDAHGFYDRSLGPIANSASKPYQLTSADNTAKGGSRVGKLETAYDVAGNLTRMQVRRDGPCLPSGPQCSQIFAYQWDEVGRLSQARRWDVPSSALGPITGPLPPAQSAKITLEYAYDAGDQRVIKSAKPAGSGPAGAARHTLYIFESLELRRAQWVASKKGEGFDYELTPLTEVPYLFASGVRLARVVFEPPKKDVPTVANTGYAHVFFELGDHLGSTSVVLDKATSELVERATFEGYGARESDYRPERWEAFREDYGFTGKEEDVEVGLAYFGKRYYAPLLNRWVSADPLAIHGFGADPNLYAYVSGHALRSIDPLGLEENAAIRVNTAPEGVQQGQYFFIAAGSGGAQGFNSLGELRKAAADKGVPIFQLDRTSSVSLKAAESETQFFQALANLGAMLGKSTEGPSTPGGKGEGGTCSGPACGTAKPGQKGAAGTTDIADVVALAGGIAAGETELREGGSPKGSPGGRCATCAGSKAQQVAIGAIRIASTIGAARGTAGVGAGRAAITHKHHTIPREILKQLPPDVAKAVRGTAGAPNRWSIPADVHKAIHKGRGGGAYNEAFKQRLRELNRDPTSADVTGIRDDLVKQFGLEQFRP